MMKKHMMKEKKIPVEFWAEAVNTVVYLQNRSFTTSVSMKTPFEALTGRKPSVRHLKVFGCVRYTHIPDQLRQKLDDKAEFSVFVGYRNCEKGYIIYILKYKKIVLARSVVFDENIMHACKNENEDSKPSVLN